MNLADTKSLSGSGQSFEHPATEGMLYVPGGTFRMDSDRHYPDEAPVHRVTVDGFWMDRTPVTNRQFRKFVNGLHDMIGNVWEWTAYWYSQKHEAGGPKACCIPILAAGPEGASYDSRQPNFRIHARCLKAARTFALPPTAAAIVRPRVMPSRSTPQQAMSASGASPGRGSCHE